MSSLVIHNIFSAIHGSMLKPIYALMMLSMLLVSCTTASPMPEVPAYGVKAPLPGLSITETPPFTGTSMPIPTVSPTIPPTATQAPTLTASITSTPTDDLSFYNAAACIPRDALVQRGTVTQVIDGDTVYILLEDGKTYRVRYIGVDAPENEERYFTESFTANSDLVLQKDVILIKDISDVDPFDRLLRYVIVDGVFVNLELVRLGLAKAISYPPDVACDDAFSATEEEAQAAQLGLWVATPTPEASPPNVVILSVNKREEWVDIQNAGSFAVDLTGWKLVSERGNQECYLSGILNSGETLRIWSGVAQGNGFGCGYSNPIWNNSEPDPAVLYNAQGVEVSRK